MQQNVDITPLALFGWEHTARTAMNLPMEALKVSAPLTLALSKPSGIGANIINSEKTREVLSLQALDAQNNRDEGYKEHIGHDLSLSLSCIKLAAVMGDGTPQDPERYAFQNAFFRHNAQTIESAAKQAYDLAQEMRDLRSQALSRSKPSEADVKQKSQAFSAQVDALKAHLGGRATQLQNTIDQNPTMKDEAKELLTHSKTAAAHAIDTVEKWSAELSKEKEGALKAIGKGVGGQSGGHAP